MQQRTDAVGIELSHHSTTMVYFESLSISPRVAGRNEAQCIGAGSRWAMSYIVYIIESCSERRA
jgi:hypothetical protein